MALGPSYRRLFAASTISNLGDGVGVIAYPWLASAITRNPLLIALVAAALYLPARFLDWFGDSPTLVTVLYITAFVLTGFLVVLPAGYLADRARRTRVIAIVLAIRKQTSSLRRLGRRTGRTSMKFIHR